MEMTREALRAVCKEHKLYLTPALNDKLYCNFKGFGSVGGLEEYVNLKALFLEGNAIESLRGLPPLPALKCLYAQQNLLTSLEGLGALPALDTLNISGNQLATLAGLEHVPTLHTLVCTDNQLEAADALAPLAACTALESVDLQNNKLADPAAALAVLGALPQLKCLYLRGNPLVSALPSYRKAVIAALPALSYLDDRPVFERERRCAEAWARGGLEAERAEREACVLEEQEREKRHFQALQRVREEGFRKRREALGLPPGNTDPFLDTVDDSEWVFEEEPEELRAARERLEAYTRASAAAAGQAQHQDEEALPDLGESAGGWAHVTQPASVFDASLTEDDVQAVMEERAASLAELLVQQGAGSATHLAQPVENSNPNATAKLPVGPAAAGAGEAAVQAAMVTVAVKDCGAVCGGGVGSAPRASNRTPPAGSLQSGEGLLDGSEEPAADSDDEAEWAVPLGAGADSEAAGLAGLVAQLAMGEGAGGDSEAGSESVTSEGDLEELD